MASVGVDIEGQSWPGSRGSSGSSGPDMGTVLEMEVVKVM